MGYLDYLELTSFCTTQIDNLTQRCPQIIVVKIHLEVEQVCPNFVPTLQDGMELLLPLRKSLAEAVTELLLWEDEFQALLPTFTVRIAGTKPSVWVEAELYVEFDAEGETEDGLESGDSKKSRQDIGMTRRQLRSMAIEMPAKSPCDSQLYNYLD